jgi:hypothetical protein
VAATEAYRGVERGELHVNKVFHPCKDTMCIGETAPGSRSSQDIVQVAITVSNVDTAAVDSGTGARATFVAAFVTAVAETLAVDATDISIDTITIVSSSDTLRRWLQAVVAGAARVAVVSFTITVDIEGTAALAARIMNARNSTTTTSIKVGDGAAALVPTLTEPTVVPHDTTAGIQCREGHDPTSPLCHVCMEGAAQHRTLFLNGSSIEG